MRGLAPQRWDSFLLALTRRGKARVAVVALIVAAGGGYAVAALRALPRAVQVADRWHLMENASQAFLAAVRKSMRQIRASIGAAA